MRYNQSRKASPVYCITSALVLSMCYLHNYINIKIQLTKLVSVYLDKQNNLKYTKSDNVKFSTSGN